MAIRDRYAEAQPKNKKKHTPLYSLSERLSRGSRERQDAIRDFKGGTAVGFNFIRNWKDSERRKKSGEEGARKLNESNARTKSALAEASSAGIYDDDGDLERASDSGVTTYKGRKKRIQGALNQQQSNYINNF